VSSYSTLTTYIQSLVHLKFSMRIIVCRMRIIPKTIRISNFHTNTDYAKNIQWKI
jgi:hypothetical protein